MKRRGTLLVLIFLTVLSATLLLSGSSLLTLPLLKDPLLPAGTIISWAGLITWVFCFTLIHQELFYDSKWSELTRTLSLTYILPALWWGLISYALAGNWTYNFSSAVEGFRGSAEAGKVFWYFTYLTAGFPVLVSLILIIALRPKRSNIIG